MTVEEALRCLFGGMIGVAVLMGIYLFVRSSGTQLIEVDQEERVVLYRFGRFTRLVGPGLVTLTGFEREVRRIKVRSEYSEYRTNFNYFINGVPFNYTVSFWRVYDLLRAANGDRSRLAELAQYTDDERYRHTVTKLHEAFHKCVQEIQTKYTVGDKEPIVKKLLPILPGMPGCDELLTLLREELLRTLPLVGVTMDTRHPFMIAGVHVTPEVIASFSRGRSLTMLSEQLPDVSPDLLLQAFSAIEGLDMHTVRLHMDGGGAVREIKLEGEEIDAYKIKTTPNEPAVRQGQKVADSPLRSFPAASDGGDEQLGKADLDVLKQLPASDAQRAAS